MMRIALGAMLAASAIGPWSGCDHDRQPVAPPASPPAERAPKTIAPAELPSDDGILLLTATRRLG